MQLCYACGLEVFKINLVSVHKQTSSHDHKPYPSHLKEVVIKLQDGSYQITKVRNY